MQNNKMRLSPLREMGSAVAEQADGGIAKLGLEIVALRIRLQSMEKSGNRLARALKRLARTDYEGEEGVDKLLKDWEDASNE